MWSGAVTVAALAVVLIALSMISLPGSRQPSAPVDQLAPTEIAEQSRALYQQALEAERSGDTTRALEMAGSAVKLDPANAEARELLDRVSRQSAPTSPSTPSTATTDTSPTAQSDALFLKAYKPLSRLMPKSAVGFDLGSYAEVDTEVTMSGSPTEGGQPVSVVLWAVHDFGTAAKATKFVSRVKTGAFTKNKATLSVDGVKAYFGTDGIRFATVAFARGRYAFEVIATTVKGAKPVQAKSIALEAARAFPDTPVE